MSNFFATEGERLIRLLISIIILVAYYYKFLNWVRDFWVARIAKKVWNLYKGKTDWKLFDVENVITLMVSILLQFGLFVVLGIVLDFDFYSLFPDEFLILPLFLGVLLGFSEMALASGFVLVVMRLMILLRPSAPTSNHYWFILLNSGWMRLFSRAEALLPKWQARILVAAYVGVEEIIYRPVYISALLPFGKEIALLVSTVIFAGYQIFNVPNARAAIYPMIGALVLGLINGSVFIHTGLVWPLVVAHIIFFISVSNSVDRS